MRYENWDVLLFPEDSKVPVQEFKTQCFVTRDTESPYIRSPSIMGPAAYYIPQGNLGQIPVLSSFIPSLPANTPFRVSIHSWDKPRPSKLMDNLLQPDDFLSFEVRVYVDGVFVSATAFGHRTNWPHVIDLSTNVDKSGNPDSLRFPPFHQEILEQRHWDAADVLGRVRIVLSEGFHRPDRAIPFERVKDIVAFSFQHAPLSVLERANIAWPNASMWTSTPAPSKYFSGGAFNDAKDPEDAHAHSPTRHVARQTGMGAPSSQSSNSTLYNMWAYRNYQQPSVPWQNSARDLRWPPQEHYMPETYIDPVMLNPAVSHRGARLSLDDVPMPDYLSSSASSRAFSSMTGVSYEHSKQSSLVGPLCDEQYNQFIEALSPPKMPAIGTHAPQNTPSVTVPMGKKLSAAAEARSASYSKSRRPSVLKEISQPGTREVSGSSARSTVPSESIVEVAPGAKHPSSPNGPIKGRKETLSENKENETVVETTRRESDKLSPARGVRRTSGTVDVPTESIRSRSGGSAGEAAHAPKEVVSPRSLSHSKADDAQHSSIDEFLSPNKQVVGSGLGVIDIE